MRKYNLLFAIILSLFFCRELIRGDSLSLAEEIGSHTTRLGNEYIPISAAQVQVIRINPYDKNWKNILENNLNYGDNVLILGHGIFTPKGKFSTNFASELSSKRGYNKAVVLDYGWHVGTPFASTKAGYSLAKVASISMSETGNDPGVYGHSNFTVAINRSAYFITGSRLPWMPFLGPTKQMQNIRYKEVIFGGSPLDYETKLDVLESVISGRTQQGESALFNVYSPHDIATDTYQMYIDKRQIKFGLKWLGESRNIKVEPQTLLGGSIYEHSRMVTDPSLYKTLPSVDTEKGYQFSIKQPQIFSVPYDNYLKEYHKRDDKYPPNLPPLCPPFCGGGSGGGLSNISPLQSDSHNKGGDAAGVAGHIRGEEIEDTTGKIEEEGNLAKEAIKKTPFKSIFTEY